MKTGMWNNPIIVRKQAVDQALRVRWGRDFANRAAYEQFLQDLVYKRNQTRDARFTAEKEILRPLPAAPLSPCKELRVTVSRFSTIHVGSNMYSVPSRLIGTTVMIRVRAETLEGYVGTSPVFMLPRLVGKHKHRIDYHHIIWSLVRKPGAFAAYQYRDELFPTTTFRLAYDRLLTNSPKRSNQEYVRILHLAATASESEVETALSLLLETGTLPTFLAVREPFASAHCAVYPTPAHPTPRSLTLRSAHSRKRGPMANHVNRHDELRSLLERLNLGGMAAVFADLAL